MNEYKVGDTLEIISNRFCQVVGIIAKIIEIEEEAIYISPLDTTHCCKINCINYKESIDGCKWDIPYITEYTKKVIFQNRNKANKE